MLNVNSNWKKILILFRKTKDAIKSPLDPGKSGPRRVPRTHTAFFPLHISPESEGPFTGDLAAMRGFPSITPKVWKKTTNTCVTEISESESK